MRSLDVNTAARVVAFTAVLALLTSAVAAQSPTTRDEPFYVEGFAQSAFGNVTSQAFGGEAGMRVKPRLHVFVEAALARDTAPKSFGAAAQLIAGYLTQVQPSAVGFSVRQPVRFLVGGVRYHLPYNHSDFEPYVLAGFGVASVERDVGFTIGGTDVTSTIGTYGVALGKDLSGSLTKGMLSLGGGLVWNISKTVFGEAQYRFGRVFDEPKGFNLNRVGVGIGVRF